MTDVEATTTELVTDVVKEIGKFAVKSAAQTAVEVTAAVVLLGVVGLTVQRVREAKERRAMRNAKIEPVLTPVQ